MSHGPEPGGTDLGKMRAATGGRIVDPLFDRSGSLPRAPRAHRAHCRRIARPRWRGVTSPSHLPVMPAEVVAALAPSDGDTVVDCTFGRGGHARRILERLGPGGRLLAMDRDPEAISAAAELATSERRLTVFHGCFDAIGRALESRRLPSRASGILFDLGVSSAQLDDPERGFSFRDDGPLDMRMDTSGGITAAEWINAATPAEIHAVIRRYGEERNARRIAAAIARAREQNPLTRTRQLAGVVVDSLPARDRHSRASGRRGGRSRHPATKTFQAIRIFINDELALLERALVDALECLAPGGRLVVISFHSLEDRIVKRFIRDRSRGPTLPRRLPLPVDSLPAPELVTVGRARRPAASEIEANPRARSAVLRAARRPE